MPAIHCVEEILELGVERNARVLLVCKKEVSRRDGNVEVIRQTI